MATTRQRQLAAIMFTDMVGYTALMESDEEAARAARFRHRTVLESAVSSHGGQLLQYFGDGSLSLFPSALSAARAAVEIQRALREEPPLPLRVGIHQGEVAFDDQGVYGDAVNVAARIQGLGSAGTVLVSGKVFDELKNKPDVPARLLGEVRLKNVAHPVRVYALAAAGLETPASFGGDDDVSVARGAHAMARSGEWADSSSLPLIDRLNRLLAPEYVLESQLDDRGESLVFEARDVMLERRVAVKLIRPEDATAGTVDRFLREARILANLHDPNIVPVYRAGRAGEVPYCVMELIEGETLASRMRQGRLSAEEAVAVARGLLDALAAAHAAGIIHRHVAAEHVFLAGDRVMLGGFHAGVLGSGRARAAVAAPPGPETPERRSVEQRTGQLVTERTDVYAAAMLIYEALTGRRWIVDANPASASWTGVPRAFTRPLRRALEPVPRRRWSDAARFRRALFRPWRPRMARGLASGAALAAVIAVALLVLARGTRPASGLADLAILPFDVGFAADSAYAYAVTHMIADYLSDIPGLTLVPLETTQRWSLQSDRAVQTDVSRAALQLRSRHVARGTVSRVDGGFHIRFRITDPNGEAVLREDFDATAGDPMAAARRAALAIASEFLLPPESLHAPGCPTPNVEALIDFVSGERARYRAAWRRATELYQSALARDPMLMQARWQLVNVWRWMPGETPDLRPHLDTLVAGGPCRLSRVDSMMVAAQRGPPGLPRLRGYARAVEIEPRSAYAAMLYGEEMFHRGPLAGFPPESTTLRLEAAVALDPNLAPAHELIAWHHTRLGNADAARRAVERVMELFEPDAEAGRVAYALLFRHAYQERFEPHEARRNRASLFAEGPDARLQLAFAVRAGLAFELPEVQLELGEALARTQSAASIRADAHLAQAAALSALGRGTEALAQIDRAVVLRPTALDRLIAAQLRVIPGILGYPLFAEAERARGIVELRTMTRNPATAARAAWTLALASYAARAPAAADEWHALLNGRADSLSERLLRSLHATRLAHEQRYREALLVSEPLLEFDAGQRHGDPFARGVIHLQRGHWLVGLDSAAVARRAWLWAENTDIGEWPAGALQDAEIDWILSPYASFLRGLSALDDGDAAVGCVQLRRALRHWSGADAALHAMRDVASARATASCAPD